jgi:hypothetical protein
MEACKTVNINIPFWRIARRKGGKKKGRLTNSMEARRTDSEREKMVHQNFQSFGTPWERSSEGLEEDNVDDERSMAELAILVRW